MTALVIDIDLRVLLGEARDQGPRPTCMVFALSDAHAASRGDRALLSCEYLYYQALALTRSTPLQGVSVAAACKALKETGQPLEVDWPYLRVEPEALPTDWGPPNEVNALYRRAAAEHPSDCALLKRVLKSRTPVVAILFLSPSFYRPSTGGVITLKLREQPILTAVHAVLLVGLGAIDGKSAYLIRNSWGEGWGRAGHAWITEKDLQSLLIATAETGDDPDVSNNTDAA